MNQRLKEFLNQNAQETNDIQELLIDFCDEIGGKVDDMNHSVSDHIQVMKKEMVKQLAGSVQKISGVNSQALSELGTRINFESLDRNMQALLKAHENYRTEIIEDLNNINSSLSVINEIRVGLDNVSDKISSLNDNVQKSFDSLEDVIQDRIQSIPYINAKLDEIMKTIASLDDSIRSFSGSVTSSAELTDEQVKTIDNLKNSIDNLMKFAASLTGAIKMDQGSIESTLNKTRDEMMKMIGSSSKAMEEEYKKHLKKTFETIANNIQAIINKLDNDMQNRDGKNES